jgi:hydrogenase large subunit
MKISKEIVERIEGEAQLDLAWEDGRVVDSRVKFVNFRGIETILQNRHPMDALVIAARVCGICSHSHVNAAVLALESCFENAKIPLKCTQKARLIREIILNAEKIQNHLKWFGLSIVPELIKADKNGVKELKDHQKLHKALHEAYTLSLQMGAVFSGQWPHGNFTVPGGVCVDPVQSDIFHAKAILSKITKIVESVLLGVSISEALSYKSLSNVLQTEGYLSKVMQILTQDYWASIGQSHDRFIVLGIENGKKAQKAVKTRLVSADLRYVSESLENTFFKPNGYTYSKSALYKNRYFETGPLARMMIAKNPLIRDMHRRFKDAISSRILARVMETFHLIEQTKKSLEKLDLSQESCIVPKVPIDKITSSGIGVVEASRGSLIHKVWIQKGKIKKYDIITPTVWNLGNGNKEAPSVIQKALLGIKDFKQANIVFRSFDVCSVCTTQ